MSLFKIQNEKVKKIIIREHDFVENDLQKIFENNLDELLNIIFLASEYSTSFGGRIDTLGIDKNGAPCILEYKKSQNDNVINQGLSYLRWLLDHKADFEILCKKKNIKVKIDWDSPRVICIAQSYNKFDLDTADILPIKIELFRYQLYEDNLLYIEPENYQKIKIATYGIFKKGKQSKSRDERLQKNYSLKDHLKRADKSIVDLFETLREKILSLDENIIEEPKAKYIAYKLSTNFTDLEIWKKRLKIYLNIKSGQLNDPKNIARDLTKPKPIGHWGNGDYRIEIDNKDNIDYIFDLIKQSYNLNK